MEMKNKHQKTKNNKTTYYYLSPGKEGKEGKEGKGEEPSTFAFTTTKTNKVKPKPKEGFEEKNSEIRSNDTNENNKRIIEDTSGKNKPSKMTIKEENKKGTENFTISFQSNQTVTHTTPLNSNKNISENIENSRFNVKSPPRPTSTSASSLKEPKNDSSIKYEDSFSTSPAQESQLRKEEEELGEEVEEFGKEEEKEKMEKKEK